jgi:hypothetical protein
MRNIFTYFFEILSGFILFYLFFLGKALLDKGVNDNQLYVRYWIPPVFVLLLIWTHVLLAS